MEAIDIDKMKMESILFLAGYLAVTALFSFGCFGDEFFLYGSALSVISKGVCH